MSNFHNDDPITPGQRVALQKLIDRFNTDRDDKARLYVVTQLVGHDVKSIAQLTIGDWRAIRDDAYPFWHAGDWDTISQSFAQNAAFLFNRYREQITGQLRLF